MVPQWHSKSGIKENFINKWSDTNNRLFGAEAKEYSIKRAQYLREKETYNRNYNIMSYVDNKVEFKKDGGVK